MWHFDEYEKYDQRQNIKLKPSFNIFYKMKAKASSVKDCGEKTLLFVYFRLFDITELTAANLKWLTPSRRAGRASPNNSTKLPAL